MNKTGYNGFDFSRITTVAMQSVVRIQAEGFKEDEVSTLLDPRQMIPTQWSGSGFFIQIRNKSGYILTNAHVVRNSFSLHAMTLLTSQEKFKLEIIGYIESLIPDIALLKICHDDLKRFKKMTSKIPHLKLANSHSIYRGIKVMAIGYPFGMDEPNVSGGEITNFISGDQSDIERLVTNAAINPGNSGGPSIDSRGKVVGINTAIVEDAHNIGFITPVSYVNMAIKNLIEQKKVVLSDLGSIYQKNSPTNAHFLKCKTNDGVILTDIIPGSMLDKSGFKKWDIITKINEHVFDRHGISKRKERFRTKNIYDIIRLIPVGKAVEIQFVRGGKKYVTRAKTTKPPTWGIHSRPVFLKNHFINFKGAIIQELSLELVEALSVISDSPVTPFLNKYKLRRPCLVISSIMQGSEFDNMDLAIGDIIDKVNGHSVFSLDGMVKRIKLETKKINSRGLIWLETASGKLGSFNCSVEVKKIKIESPLDYFIR